jgi:signal transduction histidine kinase
MQPLVRNLDLSALFHDISNAHKGVSLILNQISTGDYGYTLEEIRPLLIAALEANNRVLQLTESKSLFLGIDPTRVAKFDMLAFLQKKHLEFSPIAQCNSLSLHYETSPSYKHGCQVQADIVNIERMLCNLLSNAIKYTNSGDIFLRLFNQGDDLAVEIEDTGVGISDEYISNIFLPFWRSPDSVSRAGMGLGLYIALCVAHAHDLKMSASSLLGKGTKFTIIFPYTDEGVYGLNDTICPKGERLQDALFI